MRLVADLIDREIPPKVRKFSINFWNAPEVFYWKVICKWSPAQIVVIDLLQMQNSSVRVNPQWVLSSMRLFFIINILTIHYCILSSVLGVHQKNEDNKYYYNSADGDFDSWFMYAIGLLAVT